MSMKQVDEVYKNEMDRIKSMKVKLQEIQNRILVAMENMDSEELAKCYAEKKELMRNKDRKEIE